MAFLDLNLKLANLSANLVGGVFLFYRKWLQKQRLCLRSSLAASQSLPHQRRTILEPRRPLERLLVQSISLVQGLRLDYAKRVRLPV